MAEAILQAAEDVFAERGPHEAHVNEIAARAGVSVGTLYNYFKDRENLLCALLAARSQELMARLDGVLASEQERPFREQLRAFLTSLMEHFEIHRRFLSILLQANQEGRPTISSNVSAGAGGEPRAGGRPAMHEIYARIEELIRRGLLEDALRPEDATLYPAIFMGMVKGVFMRLAFDGMAIEPVATAERMVTFFLSGAGATQGAGPHRQVQA